MNTIQAIETLEDYKSSLVEIENRFTHERNGIHINIDDITEVKRLVIELRDTFNDLLGQNDYAQLIINSYEEGTSNMYGSPSLHCVKDIQAIITSVISRIKRNPEILESNKNEKRTEPTPNIQALDIPEKITLAWLFKHVPVKFWLLAAGFVLSAFVLGVKSSQYTLIKEIFGL